jgi:hypothetical protein
MKNIFKLELKSERNSKKIRDDVKTRINIYIAGGISHNMTVRY